MAQTNEIASMGVSCDGSGTGAAAAMLGEVAVLHLPGRSGLAGTYEGREAILSLAARVAYLTGNTLRCYSPRVLTEQDGATVVMTRVSATRGGRRLDTEVYHVVSSRRGMGREAWVFCPDQCVVDDFWR